jgi:hypothetical protein
LGHYEKKVKKVMVNNSTNIINKANNYLSPEFTEHEKDHDIWRWKSRSWLGTYTKICIFLKSDHWHSTFVCSRHQCRWHTTHDQLWNQCLSSLTLWLSNSAHGEVYSIQHYGIKFASDLRQVSVFSRYFGLLHQ